MEEPITASEDFSYFVEQGIPGFYFSLGGADPEKFAQAKAEGTRLPSNHSPLFAPDVDPALRTGIAAEVAVLRNLLKGSAEGLHKSVAAVPGGQESCKWVNFPVAGFLDRINCRVVSRRAFRS